MQRDAIPGFFELFFFAKNTAKSVNKSKTSFGFLLLKETHFLIFLLCIITKLKIKIKERISTQQTSCPVLLGQSSYHS